MGHCLILMFSSLHDYIVQQTWRLLLKWICQQKNYCTSETTLIVCRSINESYCMGVNNWVYQLLEEVPVCIDKQLCVCAATSICYMICTTSKVTLCPSCMAHSSVLLSDIWHCGYYVWYQLLMGGANNERRLPRICTHNYQQTFKDALYMYG